MRRIFFVKPLIEALRGLAPPQVTYRRTRKMGDYRVHSGGRFRPKDEGMTLHFFRSGIVETKELTDEDAQLAGIGTADELLNLFKKWYGDVPSTMYRNYFRVEASP